MGANVALLRRVAGRPALPEFTSMFRRLLLVLVLLLTGLPATAQNGEVPAASPGTSAWP
jgi:hypothetical protein